MSLFFGGKLYLKSKNRVDQGERSSKNEDTQHCLTEGPSCLFKDKTRTVHYSSKQQLST